MELGGGSSGATDIKQTDQALNPSADDAVMGMIMKSRIDPKVMRAQAWLTAEALENGEIAFASLKMDGATVATNYNIVSFIQSIAIGGKGRDELVTVLSRPRPRLGRLRSMFGRGNNYEDGGQFD